MTKLKPGNFVATDKIKDQAEYMAICQAFIDAGAARGEFALQHWWDYRFVGFCHDEGVYHHDSIDTFVVASGRNYSDTSYELTPDQVLGREPDINAKVLAEKVGALDVQVGGDHYKKQAIQPVEYVHANDIGFFEGNVIKYVTRWRDKNGIADLEKAKHYLELLIELEARK